MATVINVAINRKRVYLHVQSEETYVKAAWEIPNRMIHTRLAFTNR